MNHCSLISTFLNKNNEKIIKRFNKVYKNKILEDGYLYIYYNSDRLNWYKIGRTKRHPEKRVLEQNGILLFYKETKYNKSDELLIHLILDFARQVKIDIIYNKEIKHIEWFYVEDINKIINLIDIVCD